MSQWTNYLDFTGSILSGVIGGLMTYYGVKLTLDRTQKDKVEEDNRTSIKDIIKLIKIVEQYSSKTEDAMMDFNIFFNKYPSTKQYEAGFTADQIEYFQKIYTKCRTKSKETRNDFENVYYDALEGASLINRDTMLSVTRTFNEIREHFKSEGLIKPAVTSQDEFEFLQANYDLLKLMRNLLRNLQNELTGRLDKDLHDYYKEYKDEPKKP
ncbi:hypothetical protein MHB45_28115 [Peribacillus sp. FSL K6-5616]|uniref:hypothetical protein n=1 Tax=Peribacillus TaxID=2675229 RepID=UPI0030FB5AD5